MAISASTLFSSAIELAQWTGLFDKMKKFEFTLNHDECECCASQVKMLKIELEKTMKKYPNLPKELQEKMVQCCCY